MKQCPTCKTTYTDTSLVFCLADGGTLVDLGTEAETVIRPGVRVDIPSATYPTVTDTGQQPQPNRSPVLKIVVAILIVGFLGLIALAAAGVIFYLNTGGPNTATASPTPTPIVTPSRGLSPTPDPEKERLEKELANLQKQLEENANVVANAKPSPWKTPGFESDELPTARVNSPADGFLALRSEPDSETGARLAQIPHGTVVTLESCEKEQVKIGSRTGRWCMVTYRGQTGWVFDAWLEY